MNLYRISISVDVSDPLINVPMVADSENHALSLADDWYKTNYCKSLHRKVQMWVSGEGVEYAECDKQ